MVFLSRRTGEMYNEYYCPLRGIWDLGWDLLALSFSVREKHLAFIEQLRASKSVDWDISAHL